MLGSKTEGRGEEGEKDSESIKETTASLHSNISCGPGPSSTNSLICCSSILFDGNDAFFWSNFRSLPTLYLMLLN